MTSGFEAVVGLVTTVPVFRLSVVRDQVADLHPHLVVERGMIVRPFADFVLFVFLILN